MKKTVMAAAAFALASGAARAAEFKAVNVEPLVKASWNQCSPYTDFAPVNRSTHQHLYNGCVAVALSQVMHYWNWPTRTDDAWRCTNMADGVPGFAQQLLAGTEIDWAAMLDDYVVYGSHKPTCGEMLALGKGQILTSIVVEMKFKKEASGADASRFAFNPWFARPTEMNNMDGAADSLPLEERYAKVRTALTNGIPLLCTIDVAMSGKMVGHEIVVDGWRETNETDGEIHLNYGWGGYNDQWVPFKTCSVKSFMFNFVPRPKVIPEAIPAQAALPVAVKWHFPTRGYEKSLTGFTVSCAEATDETETLQDDFDEPKGTTWGELVTREAVADCGNDSTVLRIDNNSDRSTYTYPSQLLGADAEFSFRYRSDHAKNQSVSVEAYEAAHGWRTLESLELNSADASEWTERVISLADYAGKATALRFRTERSGVGADCYSGDAKFGVQIDDVKLTQVRKLKAAKTISVDADVRACAIGGDLLSAGKTYVVVVSPEGVADGEAGHGVATTVVSAEPEKVAITGVQSVHADGCQFSSGIFRNCLIGTNQFAVYTSSGVTKLRATLSHPALIDEVLVDDVAVPGTKILSPTSVTLNEPKIEAGDAGKWLVTLDFSNLTSTSENAQELIMIEAEDALGNVARKDVIVKLTSVGNEASITPDAIPDYSGTPESETDDPVTPVETTCLVLFEANGGDGTVAVKFNNGDVIAFPQVSCAGHVLEGWYTLAVGGTKIEPTAKVTKSTTYYAHWIEESSGGDDDEPETPTDPDEPTEEAPVVTPTFPAAEGAGPNDDAAAMTRFCPGVKNASSGVYDVTRTFSNYLIPAGHNLLYWWIDRYKAANGSAPSDYVEQSAVASSDGSYTIQSYTAELLDKALKTTLPAGDQRQKYFPSAMIAVADWQDGATDDGDKLRAVGRHVYAALAEGPIGIRVSTYRAYGAVIWGCEYAESDDGNYATALYVTDTVLNTRTDAATRRELKMTSNNYSSGVGLLNFNNTASGVISHFYPISAPAPKASGGGEVTVKVTAGDKEFDISKAFSKVEKVAGGAVAYTLDATAKVKVKGEGDVEEEISVQPELADGDGEMPFEVRDGKLVFKVKSIPGLKYQVLASDSLEPDSFAPAGQEREATGTRRELTVTRSGEAKGFYKIQVSR